MTENAKLVHIDAPPAVERAAEPSFNDLMEMGRHLVSTGFLPAHIRTPAQCAAIILTGRELGMPPMRALRSLIMVKGKVTENADSQLGRFKASGGHAVFRALTDEKAELWLRHPNGDEHTETFTIADAKAAGLAGGSDSMYQKYRKAMLRSRAITAGLKSVGWDGAVGEYDPDELTPAPAVSATIAEPVHVVTAVTTPNVVASLEPDLAPAPVGEPTLADMLAWEINGAPLSSCSWNGLKRIAEWADRRIAKGDRAEGTARAKFFAESLMTACDAGLVVQEGKTLRVAVKEPGWLHEGDDDLEKQLAETEATT